MKELRTFAISSIAVATFFLLAVSTFSQNAGQSAKIDAENAARGRLDFQRPDIETIDRSLGSRTKEGVAADRKEDSSLTTLPQASGGSEGWQLEIRPYIWLAGIHGTLRVRNTTAEVGKSSSSVLGMLDFAAAAQVEA